MRCLSLVLFISFQATAENWHTFLPDPKITKTIPPLELATEIPKKPQDYNWVVSSWKTQQNKAPILKKIPYGEMQNIGYLDIGTQVEVKNISEYANLIHYRIVPTNDPDEKPVWICGYFLKATKK